MGMQSDIRLLLAVLAPLAGAGLVMATGKKPNLREACSFCAAAVLFLLVVSLVPAVRAGQTLHFTVLPCCPASACRCAPTHCRWFLPLPPRFCGW